MQVAFSERCPDLNGSPYLLFLSRNHPKKGVDLLIKAYINLQKSTNTKREALPKLVIAGPGLETQFGKMMKELVKKNKATDVVLFTNMLEGDAKWGAFYGCEAFVLPSHQENFGIAVVEALACGKPVLISNKVNIWREIIVEKGGIVDEDSLKGVENMLKQWINITSEVRVEMGNKAISIFQKKFTLDKIGANFFAAFKGEN
jgi:glycosyltransferase involved in cell wall biosynthesis